MRILYIVTAFPRHPGDVITPWLSETIERLRTRRIDVEVLAPSYRGLGDQRLGATVVHRFRYAPSGIEALTHDQTVPDRIREKPLWLATVPGYLLAGSLAAARLARTGRFDAIHAFWPLPHSLMGLAGRETGGVPLVSTFFGVELTLARRQSVLLGPVVRGIVRRSDAVTAISTYTADRLREMAPGKEIAIIPFGAATSPAPGDPAASPSAAVGEGCRLLFVGRLVERKGVGVLLEALEELPNALLRVVGDGPERSQLESTAGRLGIADRVEFLGFVDAERLGAEFAACDVLVLPAVEDAKGDVEGLGVVLIEALQHGRPVIASASGGIPDIVIDEETGLLVPPGDVPALRRAIERLAADPDLRRRLGSAGKEHVEKRFSWERIIDDLEGLYGRVAS